MKRTILLNRQYVFSKLMSLYGKDRNLLSDQIRDFIRKWFRCRWWGGEGNLFHFYRTFVISGLRRKRRIFTTILAEFCEEEYDVVGKIVYHIFISFAFFPVQFCEISLQNTFIGQYPDWFVPKIYITQRQFSLFWCVDAKQIWLWTIIERILPKATLEIWSSKPQKWDSYQNQVRHSGRLKILEFSLRTLLGITSVAFMNFRSPQIQKYYSIGIFLYQATSKHTWLS